MGDPKVRACTFISGFITSHLSHLYTHSYVVLYILKGDNLQAHKSKLFIPRTTCSVYLCSTNQYLLKYSKPSLNLHCKLTISVYYSRLAFQFTRQPSQHCGRPMGQTATKINLECFCSGASVSQEFPIFFI